MVIEKEINLLLLLLLLLLYLKLRKTDKNYKVKTSGDCMRSQNSTLIFITSYANSCEYLSFVNKFEFELCKLEALHHLGIQEMYCNRVTFLRNLNAVVTTMKMYVSETSR